MIKKTTAQNLGLERIDFIDDIKSTKGESLKKESPKKESLKKEPLREKSTKEIDSYILDSAKYYALKLVTRGYYSFSDLDDLNQEILTLFYFENKKYKYDDTKSSHKHWVTIIIENIFKHLIRKAKLHSRYFSKKSLNDPNNINKHNDENSSEVIDMIQDDNANTFEEYYKLTQEEKLIKAMNNLPDDLKQLCRLLQDKNVTEIAKELKLSRDTIYRKIHIIKEIFKEAGIDG